LYAIKYAEIITNATLSAAFLRYRETGASDWSTFPVSPSGSTEITIQRLTPSTDYQFQVVGKNSLGDGMFSQIINVQTKGKSGNFTAFHV